MFYAKSAPVFDELAAKSALGTVVPPKLTLQKVFANWVVNLLL